jgi:hypothetical protein
MPIVILSLVGLLPQALFLSTTQAQWAVRVIDWRFGVTQTTGQSPKYFPSNVLGPVDPSASQNVPSSDPRHICSLGRSGWMILEFDPPILNSEGSDFIVFENAFEYANGLIYDEWMAVEASENGIDWKAFPTDSLTGEGFAGRTPTQAGAYLALDPTRMGGDAFDLDRIGLNTARYLRLTDATRFQTPDRLGAEVDGVYVIHQLVGWSRTRKPTCSNQLYFHKKEGALTWNGDRAITLNLWSVQGTCLIQSVNLEPSQSLPVDQLAKGIYLIYAVDSSGFAHRQKILID